MKTVFNAEHRNSLRLFSLQHGLNYVFLPLPVPLINLTLTRIVKMIAARYPEIFNRLEGHHHKWFMINPTNMPFQLYLLPDPEHPQLKCRRKHCPCPTDSKISGSFLTLLGMIDGRYDGDALFFTRDLCVEGDTEAVVCLRNALDDVEGSLADDIATFFGTIGKKFLKIARKVSAYDSDR